MDYIRQYDVTCRNLSLFDQRKYELMHNLFRDDAKEWFFANIVECVPTFSGGYSGAIIKLREEYESSTRQERVKQVLDCITFDEFVEGTGTYPELKTALDRLKTRIVKLTQQCAPAFRGSEHQIAYLRREVLGKSWSEFPLQVSPPHKDLNKLVAALGASIQHDASKVALLKQVPHQIPTLPTYYQGDQQRLRNPTYGRTRWERGKLVPTHSKQSQMPAHKNRKTFLSDAHRPTRRRRSWINEDTGFLKPDASGNKRFCHKCGGQNHLSFEVEFCDPNQSKGHISTRFASGDAFEDIFLDVLDCQLTPDELKDLQDDAEQNFEPIDESNIFNTDLRQDFETLFAERFEGKFSHIRGDEC
jgi:hypothetical protein